jgi:hypothetical protein
MPPENRAPALWLFRSTLNDIERAALETWFGERQAFRPAVDRLLLERAVPSPCMSRVRPLAVVNPL